MSIELFRLQMFGAVTLKCIWLKNMWEIDSDNDVFVYKMENDGFTSWWLAADVLYYVTFLRLISVYQWHDIINSIGIFLWAGLLYFIGLNTCGNYWLLLCVRKWANINCAMLLMKFWWASILLSKIRLDVMWKWHWINYWWKKFQVSNSLTLPQKPGMLYIYISSFQINFHSLQLSIFHDASK